MAAVALGAGAGELVAALALPTASPIASMGAALIDLAPPWAKDAAIGLFGTADKLALIAGVVVVLVVVAAIAGLLEVRVPPWGRVLVVGLGLVGAVVASTRPDATGMAWIPSAVAGVVAAAALGPLARRCARAAAHAAPFVRADPADGNPDVAPAAPDPASAERGTGLDRRGFLLWSGVAAGAGVIAALGGWALQAGRQAASAVREAIALPRPAQTAAPIPATADLGIPDLAPVITPNAEFYRIDTALLVPDVDPHAWSLRIHGMVAREVVITWDELLALPLQESVTTLACVSNEVGGTLIGNAVWLGYPIRELLRQAGPDSGADMVLSRSVDGFTASTPLEALTDERNAILAVGMNGEPLPAEHGFPVRMVVPGLYGYVSATKWVTELQVTRFDAARAYWTDRGWSERGPIKLQSRIDVPRSGRQISAGDTVVAGVAWQQHVGIAAVEVQIDDGEWMPATLATAISDDTWVQWSMPWTATTGTHTVRCRAINARGQTQTGEHAPVVPDGATGWHQIGVTVA
ncbi:molybdopterin-dependent oxidoreductase [Microbacterium invictum]